MSPSKDTMYTQALPSYDLSKSPAQKAPLYQSAEVLYLFFPHRTPTGSARPSPKTLITIGRTAIFTLRISQ